MQYRFDFGDGITSSWSSSTSASHSYSGAGTFYVKAQARCASDHSVVSSWSSSKSVRITCEHTVSKPNTPSGPSSGKCNASLTFSTSGANCSQGHSVQYQFDFGDGTISSWSSSTSASHSYSGAGTFSVKAQARCSSDHSVVSSWSSTKAVKITSSKKPDLVVEDIYWRPIDPTEEDSLGLYIKLWNKGALDASSFYFLLQVDGHLLTEGRIDGLPSGRRTTLMISEGTDDWSWKHDCDVSHTLKAFADAHHEIVESDESNNTLEKSIRVKCVEPSGSFTATSFTARCLETGPYANHIDCELSYQNDLGEQALIVFIFKKASTGEVIGKARPYANEGSGQAGALFECPLGEPGTYRLSWKAYKGSDVQEQNPVAWCKPDDEINIGCPCGSADIPDTTVVLDSATQQVMTDVTADEVHFSTSTPLLDRLETSDIIVCGVTDKTPYGMLRNVERISRSYGVTLETTQAKLVDAVNKGSVSVSQQLKQSDVVSTSTAPGVQMRLHPEAQVGQLKYSLDAVLYDGYGATVTTSGDLTISPEFFFNVSIDWGGIKYISFRTEVTQEADLKVHVNGTVVRADYSKELYRVYFTPITVPIGPVPVVLVPVLTVNVSVTGEVAVGMTTGVRQWGTFEAELSYDNGVWSTTRDHDIHFEHDDPEYSSDCDMTGSIGPELGLLLYGVVGPYANIEGYLEFEADFYPEVTWKLWGGLNVNGGVKFDALGHRFDHEEKLFGIRDLLAQSTEAQDQTPPETTITSGPGKNETLSEDRVTFKWTGADDVTTTSKLRYTYVLEGKDSGWSSYSRSTKKTYPNLPDGDYTFHVAAADEANKVDTTPATRSFTISTSPEPDELKACFSFSPQNPKAGDTVSFYSSCSEGNIEAYEWDFNDNGATSTKANPSHTYNSPDNYDVTLTVKGPDGEEDTDTATHEIEVSPEPEPQEPEAKIISGNICILSDQIQATPEVKNTGTVSGDFQVRLYAQLDDNSWPESPDKKTKHISNGTPPEKFRGRFALVLDDLDSDPDSYKYVWLELWQVETEPYTLCDMYGHAPDLGLANSQLVFTVTCPVDLEVTDPDGLMVSKESSQILDATYTEKDLNGDGDPDDQIMIPNRKIGDYQVRVIPEPRAKPTDTYTLEVSAGGEFETLAEEQQIKDIPDEPYQFESTSSAITSIDLSPGWTMVSSPLSGESALDLFGTSVYRWNPATRKYDTPTNIEPTKGYWVKVSEDTMVTATGEQLTSDVTIDISAPGWHQISAPWPYPKDAIQVTKAGLTKSWNTAMAAGWVRGTIYGYKSTDGEYTTPSTINPWYGYWVRAKVSGLTLKLLYASRTPVAPVPPPPTAFAPMDLPSLPGSMPIAPLPENLEFTNIPNPITDVHTSTFMVTGPTSALVEAIKVQIFDLSGRLVYESGEIPGTSLDWHTDNDYGECLANGVYLYKIYALIDGGWVESDVRKLAILR